MTPRDPLDFARIGRAGTELLLQTGYYRKRDAEDAKEERQRMIRAGRNWAGTYFSASYLNVSSLDDECCMRIGEMSSRGRESTDILRYVRNCGQPMTRPHSWLDERRERRENEQHVTPWQMKVTM